jgi:hypothetical protein
MKTSTSVFLAGEDSLSPDFSYDMVSAPIGLLWCRAYAWADCLGGSWQLVISNEVGPGSDRLTDS